MADQAVLVVRADEIGLAAAVAPNRRLFFELALTVAWLREDRELTVDALIRRAQNEAEKELLASPSEVIGETRRRDLDVLSSIPVGEDKSRDNRAAIKHMAEAVIGGDGLAYVWTRETRYSHASLDLALAYAPQDGGSISLGEPPTPDLANSMDLALLVAIAHVHHVLEGSGLGDVGERLLDVYFSTLAKDGPAPWDS
jgi:hypothetical protein